MANLRRQSTNLPTPLTGNRPVDFPILNRLSTEDISLCEENSVPSLNLPRLLVPLLLLATFASTPAAEPLDAINPIPRHIPPAGIKIEAFRLEGLQVHLEKLQQDLAEHQDHDLYPDVAVFAKALEWALKFEEFYNVRDTDKADRVLGEAIRRLALLSTGTPDWPTARGHLVRGYQSSIDGSLQPYGLEIPAELSLDKPVPLYVWLHGRGDKTTDMHFIDQRQTRKGRIAPAGAIILHPFGRHCMGFKSAGEIDVLESIEDVKKRYSIDENRIVLMGFSMGGAGVWHIGAHYVDRWVGISPGAGFAETARYNKLTPENYPASYVQQLWTLYDVPHYVRNLFNAPVVVYSGELDKQIQAARVMEQAYQQEGRVLPHVIGPGMGHQYHPDSLKQIMKQMDDAVNKGLDQVPAEVHLQTRTLRYNEVHWVKATGLEEHWQDARIDARMVGKDRLDVTTRNISSLELSPFADMAAVSIFVDGKQVAYWGSDKLKDPGTSILQKGADGTFRWLSRTPTGSLAKRPGLQGPIDDAFMSSFLVVTPSGKSSNPLVQRWVEFELAHFLHRWESLYRGSPRVKQDKDVSVRDLADHNLILWGTPESNSLIRQLAGSDLQAGSHRLPLQWSEETVKIGTQEFSSDQHLPILIYPNPMNPKCYLVINSGPTHREGHDRTNSLQNPKLPDWAVIDLTEPPTNLVPGKIVATGLFNESWQPR
jgi:predicted esterase